ncbi:MAG: hypothetical protein IJX36_03260 [Thermoguttaceae bacterium]|nr:hypothetical protein [Thermoguttaceae bacterium]MBQ8362932.1 hypothetical protein [Thermoguttaceae bacterium]MBQ9128455.1 hypothetical protein [Thermoguttaceae bacterium]
MFLSALDGRDGRGESNDFRLGVADDGYDDCNGFKGKAGSAGRTRRSEPKARRAGKTGKTGKIDALCEVA